MCSGFSPNLSNATTKFDSGASVILLLDIGIAVRLRDMLTLNRPKMLKFGP